MDITITQLIAGGASPTAARAVAPVLGPALRRFGIDTAARVGAFLAQAHVESAGFRHLEENLFYTTAKAVRSCWPSRFPTDASAAPYLRNPKALANKAYAGRNGNGPEAGGDGWRFRGRGLIQLTGRANYAEAGRELDRPLVAQPELVASITDAVLTAAWFFADKGCIPLADRGDIDGITRRVNGAQMREAAQRRGLSARYRRAVA